MKNYHNLSAYQTVILRNYGLVPNVNIAKVLSTSEEVVVLEAQKLGLDEIKFNPDWAEKGFVTIIRSNWDLLPLSDIALLLDISVGALETLLKEYDFLDVKLGEKPVCDKIVYSLKSEDIVATACAKKIVENNFIKSSAKPFDFLKNYVEPIYFEPKDCAIKERFTSNYCAKYSGSLLDDDLSDYSVDYLKKLKSTGTNGIWLSDTLRNLAEFPFDTSLSPDYKIRIKNLKKLTERCAEVGVNVYLYMNEPRSLNADFFEKYPHLKGQKADDGTYCLCTSAPEVKNYLYNAFKSLAENVPLLKGIMTITMSENPTHCYARIWGDNNGYVTDCPRCKDRKPSDIVAELNNIYARALKDGNGYTKLISNIWGWANIAKSDEDVLDCLDKLDKNIEVLCVSEYGKKFVLGGVDSIVDDYSISVVGPSDFAIKVLTHAKKTGHKIWAKVQLNNSWECSAVPYLPVFDLMLKHVENLKEIGVEALMLGWSLGGYPGGVLPLCNSACGKGKYDAKPWYDAVYGENSSIVSNAVSIFSNAFKEFPFSVDSIYFGGHNMGSANLWSLENVSRESTMVCFTFEDYKKWTAPYGLDIYINQLDLLVKKWQKGIDLLDKLTVTGATKEFITCAKASLCHFESSLNLARFVKYKNDLESNKDLIIKVISYEEKTTKVLYQLFSEDAKIGFEMTNHYYYSANSFLEKLLNLYSIKQSLCKQI